MTQELERSPNSTVTTTTSTSEDPYKSQLVKVYQDAGVVGVSMLTLLMLCVLLGLFCSRLIKMYTTLTEGRDRIEAARTAAVEKMTENLVLLRAESNQAVTELRRENAELRIMVRQLGENP